MGYQIWDGDQYLFTVDTEAEADEAFEAGFRVVAEDDLSPYATLNS